MFPPCGRRKHILQEEGGGKMYGRNELIARHIKMKTGKLRTRKQVSSHIQVLARRKAKSEVHVPGSSNGVSPSPSSIGSGGQPQSASSLKQEEQMQQLQMQLSQHHHHQQQHHHHHPHQQHQQQHHHHLGQHQSAASATAAAAVAALCHPAATGATVPGLYPTSAGGADLWTDRPIVTQKIRLVEFSAFIEHRLPPANKRYFLSGSQSGSSSNGSPPSSSGCYSSSQQSSQQAFNPQSPFLDQPVNHHQHQHHPHHRLYPTAAQDQLTPITSGASRHNYVQIDYRHPQTFFARHYLQSSSSMLESIDIKQIQDKFPGFVGQDGYMQRGLSDAFYLVKFWADLGAGSGDGDNTLHISSQMDDQNSCFGFSSQFETIDMHKSLTCSTKACSYGFQVVEKVEKIYGSFNQVNGRYSYNLDRSPMCEFMIQFIKKLRQLPMITQMNSVLENFTVLQVIENDTLPVPEVLLCLAYVFEVNSSEQKNGPSYHVYKLTKD